MQKNNKKQANNQLLKPDGRKYQPRVRELRL